MDRTQPVKFFAGLEIEKTKHFLDPMIIAPNAYDVDECRAMLIKHGYKHLFVSYMGDLLGNPFDMDVERALNLANTLMGEGYKVSFELRPDQLTDALVEKCPEPDSEFGKLFVILVGMHFPNMKKIGAYTTVKLCTKFPDPQNGGVWCISAEDFAKNAQFTQWAAYSEDKWLA